MRVVLVHDQLQEFGGAERVLVALKNIFPEADVFTSFYNRQKLGRQAEKFNGWSIITSWADKVPLLNSLYSPLRFITPLIWETFNFADYDLVISSSGSYMSKGIVTRPETVHICYLHHPPRYLYGYETAIEWQKYWPVKIYGHLINHQLRMWDYLSSQRVDYFIANSKETQKRIKKFYRRDAEVIYPPVKINPKWFDKPTAKRFYLTVSRLARAKHVDLLIQAANEVSFDLKVVGGGRDSNYLKSIAGPTVQFLGEVSDAELSSLYKNAKAFLFASVDEEFGIAPVEAMGYGVPVVAYGSGGLKETVDDGQNGFLFESLSSESLIKKVKILEAMSDEKYLEMKNNARKKAESFSEEKFKEKILRYTLQVVSHKNNARTAGS